MTNKEKIIVLGAGPAGIGVALSLGKDGLVLERRPDIGGLSASIEMEGAVFDFGGHSFHTPHEEVRNLVFDSLDMFEQKRDARIFSYGEMIPYPFQKSFRELSDQKIVQECVDGLEHTSGVEEAANFEDFIGGRFGPGIGKHFMLPYNRKLWGRDLKRLAANWVGERVAAPEGTKEKFDTKGGKRKPLQADTKVAYPAKGGFGEIYKALGSKIENIRFGADLQKIIPKDKSIILNNGESQSWHKFVSTIPVNLLLNLIEGVPAEILQDAQQLEALSLKLVLVAIGHPVDTEIQRVYSADIEIPGHKTAVNHNSSDFLRSLPTHGIMAEISYSPEKDMYREDLEAWTVDSLLDMGIIKNKAEVIATRVIDARYAYPVPTMDRDMIMTRIKNWLAENDIFTVGRFGEWAYINSDEAIHRGLALGERLLEE